MHLHAPAVITTLLLALTSGALAVPVDAAPPPPPPKCDLDGAKTACPVNFPPLKQIFPYPVEPASPEAFKETVAAVVKALGSAPKLDTESGFHRVLDNVVPAQKCESVCFPLKAEECRNCIELDEKKQPRVLTPECKAFVGVCAK
ncbi:MAG: hypothetical protein M1833_002295 [Piccolia ochrophora]|nr:MAG: hypothetical protein M1833_002295 [Piccolia ochrophora]